MSCAPLTVSANPGGQSAFGSASPITVTGLSNDTASNASLAVTPVAAVTVPNTGSSTGTPANGSAITSTTITGRAGPNVFTLSVPGASPAMPQSVGSCAAAPPGTTFQFSITATNAIGTSAATSVTAVCP